MSDVLFERVGVTGRITLNRPKAINALTHDMARQIDQELRRWEREDQVRAVVLTGAGERGLCAGGDIVGIYRDLQAGGTATRDFWRDEYRLNALINRYPKPFVAVMDGLVMGGGIGLSGHASHRIVTERTKLAMPEVGIGLVPDVGGSWLLGRAPGLLGVHAALTGAVLGAGDAIALGLADWYVRSERVPGLLGALAAIPPGEDDLAGAIGALIEEVAGPAPAAPVAEGRPWIDDCYAAATAEQVLAALSACDEPAAQQAAGQITRKSPTCVKVALAALARTRSMTSLEQALEQEFRVSLRCFAAPDLAEGIRAQVIDKDQRPRWQPAALEQVSAQQVLDYFAPLTEELGLAGVSR